jgi:hypothetical protein
MKPKDSKTEKSEKGTIRQIIRLLTIAAAKERGKTLWFGGSFFCLWQF